MRITIVLGTARKGRRSEQVARVVCEAFSKTKEEVSFVDICDHLNTFRTTRYGMEEERPHPWKDIACDTDLFVFVLPEYNHGYPGEWKLLMDSLYKKEYMSKVAALVGVSSGQFGGARALELATLTLASRGMYVLKDALHFPRVKEQFTEEGTLASPEQEERLEQFVDNTLQYTKMYRK